MAVRGKYIKDQLREVADGKAGEKLVALMPLDPTNILELRGIILAPPGSPMEGYILFLDIILTPHFPFDYKPPKVRFKNKVWHPKISEFSGVVSLAFLAPWNWRANIPLETVLTTVQFLLSEPGEAYDSGPVNETAWKQYLTDRAAYVKTSKSWTEQDNEGYGHVTFSDYRISAIQSFLKVSGAVKYKGYVFCETAGKFTWKLTLTVIPDLTMYRECAELLFQKYPMLTTFCFEFEEDEIILNFDGITQDKCWKVTVTDVSSLKIRKEKVVSDPRKTKPFTCRLDLVWLRTEIKPQRVIHKFSLLGLKPPQSLLYSFDVCVDPDSLSNQHQPRHSSAQALALESSSGMMLYIDDLGTIQEELFSIRAKAYNIGLMLKVPVDILDSISSQFTDPSDKLRETLKAWLRVDTQQKWQTIVEMLRTNTVGEPKLASDIETKYS